MVLRYNLIVKAMSYYRATYVWVQKYATKQMTDSLLVKTLLRMLEEIMSEQDILPETLLKVSETTVRDHEI